MSTATSLGWLSLLGTGVATAVLVFLHLAPTGLSPLRNAVSHYGITRFKAGYRAMTVSMGVSGGALAGALAVALRGAGVAEIVVLLSVFAAARLAISWFPMDEPGAARTGTGATHGLLAIVTFGAAAAAAIRLCRVLERNEAWLALAHDSRILGWAMVACVAAMLLMRVAPDLRRVFGAIERALYLAMLVWLVMVGVACATGQL